MIKYVQMKNPSLILMIGLAIISAFGYFSYAYWDWTIGVYLLFSGVILLGSALIFKKEFDLWTNKKNKQTLNKKEEDFLRASFPLVEYINTTDLPIFFRKVHLFKLDKEIISQDPKRRIYHPAVLLCGAYAAYFEMNNPEVKVPYASVPVYVFYGHPFPSPQFPKHLHISEYYEEDGAILFSVPHLMKGNEDPGRFFNIALYESAKVAIGSSMESIDFPSLEHLCKFGAFSVSKLEQYMGINRKNLCVRALALSQFFTDAKRFSATYPRLGEAFEQRYIFSEDKIK